MSDLRPIGEPLMLDGVERHLLFTLNVIDAVQDHFECSLEETISLLTDKRTSAAALKYMLMQLLNDEAERVKYSNPESELKKYNEQEIGWVITQGNVLQVTVAILKAYGLSMPEVDEFASPNEQGGQNQ